MKRTRLLFIISCFLFISPAYSQVYQSGGMPEAAYPETHAFTNCTLVIKPGSRLENATLIIKDGRIKNYGVALKPPASAQVHDLNGAWIFPGFIEPYGNYGLSKTPTGKASEKPVYQKQKDSPYAWNDAIKPQFNAFEHLVPDEKAPTNLRKLGFAIIHTIPGDGIFKGTSAVVSLGKEDLNHELIREVATMPVSFRKGSSRQNYPSSQMGAIALIRQTFLDASWYEKAWQSYHKNPTQKTPLKDISLDMIAAFMKSEGSFLFDSDNYMETLRAAKIANEYGLKFVYKTKGDEYKRIKTFAKLQSEFIVPLKFPKAYDLKKVEDGRNVSLKTLREWELAPLNPALLESNKIAFSFTATGLESPEELSTAIRKAISYGLTPDKALEALTTQPAKLLGIEGEAGSLEKGKRANFFICSGDFFSRKVTLYENWINGNRFILNKTSSDDPRGTYVITEKGITFNLQIGGSPDKLISSVVVDKDTLKSNLEINGNLISLGFDAGKIGYFRFTGVYANERISGTIFTPAGEKSDWSTFKAAPFEEPEDTAKGITKINKDDLSPICFPLTGYGLESLPKQTEIIIQHATIWTNSPKGILEECDVHLKDGKILRIGKGIPVPAGVETLDATGKHVTAGLIDEHSHIAVSGRVNEGTHAVTSEVRIGDVVDCADVNIYRQLAGGITCSQLLHGSANPIGGQSALIKMKWGELPEDMKVKDAPGFIKFALGENVKQSNWGDAYRLRFPQTRMGVEQCIRDAFLEAKDYRQAWREHETKGSKSGHISPRKNLQLEALLEILDEKRFITCHSYVQSEILMLMRLAEELGFRINTFTHILEGYKIAQEVKHHGANGSTFSDWWAYKYEVIDAIPYNAALLQQEGVNVCINSDDAEMGRRLNQEAAKACKYGGVSEEEALKMVTLNPAKALHIDHRTGSVEVGKDADIVVWSGHPLSIYSKVEQTFVEGKLYYDALQDQQLRETIKKERNRLIQKMIHDESKQKLKVPAAKAKQHYHCGIH